MGQFELIAFTICYEFMSLRHNYSQCDSHENLKSEMLPFPILLIKKNAVLRDSVM